MLLTLYLLLRLVLFIPLVPFLMLNTPEPKPASSLTVFRSWSLLPFLGFSDILSPSTIISGLNKHDFLLYYITSLLAFKKPFISSPLLLNIIGGKFRNFSYNSCTRTEHGISSLKMPKLNLREANVLLEESYSFL